MADDQLRMTATLVDKITGPLRGISKNFGSFAKDAQSTLPKGFLEFEKRVKSSQRTLIDFNRHHKQSMTGWDDFRKIIGRVNPTVGDLTENMSKLVTGTGGASLAIAGIGFALVEATKSASEFALQMRQLNFASRQSGFSATQIAEMEAGARRFGLTIQDVDTGVVNFSRALVDLRTNHNGFLTQLRASGATEVADKMFALLSRNANDSAGALRVLISAMDQLKAQAPGALGEQRARELATQFGLSANFANITADGLNRMATNPAMPGFVKSFNEAFQNSRGLNQELDTTSIILGRWKNQFEADILPPVRALVHLFNLISVDAEKLGSITIPPWLTKLADVERLANPLSAPANVAHGAWSWLGQYGKTLDAPQAGPQPATPVPPADVRKLLQSPFAGVPQYQTGTANVPKDQIAALHRGEIVLPPNLSNLLRAMAGGGGMSDIAGLLMRLIQGFSGGTAGGSTNPLGSILGGLFGGGSQTGGGFLGSILDRMGSIFGGIGHLFGGGMPSFGGMGHLFGGGMLGRLGHGYGGPAPGGIIMPGGGMMHGPHVRPQGLVRRMTGQGKESGIEDVGAGLSGNQYIAATRARFAQELQDPNVRMQFAAMLLTEDAKNPVPVAESAMNRSLFRHRTLMAMLHSGFYGPINRGQLPAAMARLRNNPALMARMNKAIATTLGGSDVIAGHTDQGLPTDPGGRWEMAHHHKMINGEVFGDWLTGPRNPGGSGSVAWREQFEAHAKAAAAPHWAASDVHAALMDSGELAARTSINGAIGDSTTHKVEGTGSIAVHVRAPPGTGVTGKAGGLFKMLHIQKTPQMQPTQAGPLDIPN